MWLEVLNHPLSLGLGITLILAVITDLNAHKIPNSIVIFGLIIGVICQGFSIDGAGGLNWLAGVVVALLCFIPLYLLRGMAAGDVKLMMAVGGFLGYPLIIDAVIHTFLAGGVLALIWVLYKKRGHQLVRNMQVMATDTVIKTTSGVNVADEYVMKKNSAGRMPYALAIAIGSMWTVYWH